MLGSHEPSRSRHDHLAADSINRDDEAGRRPAAGALTTPGEKNGDARHASGSRNDGQGNGGENVSQSDRRIKNGGCRKQRW
ncbi:hypothetical protein PVAP13_7NG196287 [Panicum virgatum]|uniref:Uncharacterized protein n=1 Tax=Panicum virgatum TaxID=38727 RepID=A0A8T0Q167_PANVG|nr:hypothetical protein PVAP13_7NG196287 [Panicum virgatum]